MVRGHVNITQVTQQTGKEQPKTKGGAAQVPGLDLLQQLTHLQGQGCSDRRCLRLREAFTTWLHHHPRGSQDFIWKGAP